MNRVALTLLALVLVPLAARAQAPADSTIARPDSAVAPADSSLHRFLDTLADSTDRYFGFVAESPDTAGLDSTLEARLEKPWIGPRTNRPFSWAPMFAFNRVDGSTWGGSATLSTRGAGMSVTGDAAYATSARRWLGGGSATLWRSRRGSGEGVRVSVRGGWRTATIDQESGQPLLNTIRAALSGSDRQHYFHREGLAFRAETWRRAWFAGVELADWVELPLAVSTTWDLFHKALVVPGNLQASPGRMRGFGIDAGVRVPFVPLTAAVAFDDASEALGGDFDYRRVRATLGGELTLGHFASLVPQLRYGRLTGDAVPQASFFLGGAHSLRSLDAEAFGGTGLAIARLDLVGTDDLLALAHLPHPAFLPIQGGAFIASGAVWGHDPYGGPGSPERAWPSRGAWLSEAGVSLLYRPGIPETDGYLRLNHAWPIGPDDRGARWSISYTRALDLLPSF